MLKNDRHYRLVTGAIVAAVLVLFSFAWYFGPAQSEKRTDRQVREVVMAFGREQNTVDLLAASSSISDQIDRSYAPYVTAELLAAWMADPSRAPGRQTSSPYPDRIGISSVIPQGSGWIVQGELILVTDAQVEGESTDTIPVVVLVVRDAGEWRIAAYEQEVIPVIENLTETGEVIPAAR